MTGRQADGQWHQVSDLEVLRKTGDTGTTYKIDHDGQELRVRVRSDKPQIEFWVKDLGWLQSNLRTNEHGLTVLVIPKNS